jgi:hypothetical protein
MELTVYRDGSSEPLLIQVTLGENPDSDGGGAYLGVRGMGFIEIHEDTQPEEVPQSAPSGGDA